MSLMNVNKTRKYSKQYVYVEFLIALHSRDDAIYVLLIKVVSSFLAVFHLLWNSDFISGIYAHRISTRY
jgi:hypothetical protein